MESRPFGPVFFGIFWLPALVKNEMCDMRSAPLAIFLCLSACGIAYISPSVKQDSSSGVNVRVIPLTAETVLAMNRSDYSPKQLPDAFFSVAGSSGGARGAGALPEPPFEPESRPAVLETRLPPDGPATPYLIGVSDALVLATPQISGGAGQSTGLLAPQNGRQNYMVQDDGAITIPDVGRISVMGLTLKEAENAIFQRLVAANMNPSFSLEIAEFNSKRVSIGGAVKNPGVAPITLTPLYLDEALAQVGGTTTDPEFALVRIYRDGTLYQVPLAALYTGGALPRIRLVEGDSVFVDTEYDPAKAESYFAQQIQLSVFRQQARTQALNELQAEVSINRSALDEGRQNFRDQLEFGAVEADYVYLTGEVVSQSRFALPFGTVATLADALYANGGALTRTANPAQIYVLRGSTDPREFSSLTALHLDASNAVNLILATRLELQPNDVIFVAEQPVTKWGNVVNQITPTLISTTFAAVTQ